MDKQMDYDRLALVPRVVAESVCSEEYKGVEFSNAPSDASIAEVENLRQKMTPEQVQEFAEICDAWCRAAFTIERKWFMDCIRGRGNRGRDQLRLWMSHWLAAYLKAPQDFHRRHPGHPQLEGKTEQA